MNPKSTDIFGRLDWLTRFIKRLSGRVTSLEQNPGGLTAVVTDSTLDGDGTSGWPLRVMTPAPYFETNSINGDPYIQTTSNCSVSFTGNITYIVLGSTITIFGLCNIAVTSPGPWYFDFLLPVAANPYNESSEAVGTLSADGSGIAIVAIPGTTKINAFDHSGTSTSGLYSFYFTSKIL